MALLVLRRAVVAGAGEAGGGVLIDLAEVQGEIGGDVGVAGVDAAVEDCDADACAGGDVPRARFRGAAVAADLLDGPSLRRVVERVRHRRGDARGADLDGVGRDDSVFDDRSDVGVGGEACTDCRSLRRRGLDDRDSQRLVVAQEVRTGHAGIAFRRPGLLRCDR